MKDFFDVKENKDYEPIKIPTEVMKCSKICKFKFPEANF